MGYLQRNAHKRVNPRQVLSEAKSIICLAASYAVQSPESKLQSVPADGRSTVRGRESDTPHSPFRTPQFPGFVARYARYADYHEVLGERLKPLTEFVNRSGDPGTRSLWYVDTGPLLER
ncbi:MAG: hypothetical protein DME19_02535, partial [Verrucomicrobia bacterium]